MDLVPRPDQVVAAAINVAHALLQGGLADVRPMPRSPLEVGVEAGVAGDVYHYHPEPGVASAGDPVLLVTPIAAPTACYDLRRGCSLVEHLVSRGRPTYVVESDEVSFKDRALSLEPWVAELLPGAVRAVSEHADDRPVHVVGWSLGGIVALLTAAESLGLPIASLTVLGSPVDIRQVPLVAPPRPLLELDLGVAQPLLGWAPVAWTLQLSTVDRLVTTPLAVATHLDDAEFLAQVEAVGRFSDGIVAYPGRTYGQLYHRFVRGSPLVDGALRIGDRTIELSSIQVPVLAFAGTTDGIAPVAAVQPLLPLLTGAPETAFEIVPGGHLGQLTGRAARTATWPVIDDWLSRWSDDG